MNRAFLGVCLLAYSQCSLGAQRALSNLPESETTPIVFEPDATAIAMGSILQDDQVKELSARAENRDYEAAFRLSRHYDEKKDFLTGRYWLLRAALGGYAVAQYNLWFSLRESDDCADVGEALAWLESSARLGSVTAGDELVAYRNKVKTCTPNLP